MSHGIVYSSTIFESDAGRTTASHPFFPSGKTYEPTSQPEQAAVARHLRLHTGQAQAVPEAHLVGRQDRALEVALQGVEDRHAAEAGAGDEHAVGLGRTGGADLGVERLDLLLEAEALGVHLAVGHVAPAAPRIVAERPDRLDAEAAIVGHGLLGGGPVEPGW